MKHMNKSRFAFLLCLLVLAVTLICMFTVHASAEVTTEWADTFAVEISDKFVLVVQGTVSPGDAQYNDCYVLYSDLAENTEVKQIITPDDNGAFTVKIPVGPGRMNDTVEVQLFCGTDAARGDDDVNKGKISVSVKGYLKAVLADADTSDALRKVANTMAYYGAAALDYMAYSGQKDAIGQAGELLDGLQLDSEARLPEKLGYTYSVGTDIEHPSYAFTHIQLQLSDTIDIAVGTNVAPADIAKFCDKDGTAVLLNSDGSYPIRSVKYASFFDVQTVGLYDAATKTAVSNDVHVSASLYAELAKNNRNTRLALLVKSLYNFCYALHEACGHVYTVTDHISATCKSTGFEIGTCVCGLTKETVIPKQAHAFGAGVVDTAKKTVTYTCDACKDHYASKYLGLADFTADTGFLHVSSTTDNGGTQVQPVIADGRMSFISSSAAPVTAGNHVGFYFDTPALGLADATRLVLSMDVTMPTAGFTVGDDEGIQVIGKIGSGTGSGILDMNETLMFKNKQILFNGHTLADCVAGTRYHIAVEYSIKAFETAKTQAIYTVYLNGEQAYRCEATYDVFCNDSFNDSTNAQLQFVYPAAQWNKHNDAGVILDNVCVADAFEGIIEHVHVLASYEQDPSDPDKHRITCTCGHVLYTTQHTFTVVSVTEPSTCSAEGVGTGVCVCGKSSDIPILKTPHTFEADAVIDKTAKTISYTCAVCSHTTSYSFLAVDDFEGGTYAGNCGQWYENNAVVDCSTGKSVLKTDPSYANATNNVYYTVHAYNVRSQLTNVHQLVMGFEATMPEGGFGAKGWFVQSKCNNLFDIGSQLIAFRNTSVYVNGEKLCDVEAGVKHSFVIKAVFSEEGTIGKGHYVVYMDGAQVAAFDQVKDGFDIGESGFKVKTNQFQLHMPKGTYNDKAGDGWIIDNIFVANDVPTAN